MDSSCPSQLPASNATQPTPPRSHKQHHRLLYRGSLSLPDSDLLLDGIAFTAYVPPSSPISLLESPSALALESMRGRPSLRFVSIVNLSEVNYECAEDISMYIHPRSLLTRGFFENVLCMDRVGESGHTDSAIRIGLGDGYGPDESDLLVLGMQFPSLSTLRMTVARVTHPRTPDRIRKPRPDDPAPRKPPTFDLPKKATATKRHGLHQDAENRVNVELRPLVARESVYRLPGARPFGRGKGNARVSAGLSFKLPGLPTGDGPEDVFGIPVVSMSSRAVECNDLETSNKTVVKKAAVKALAARGMPKEHPEFKELFGWVTRGVGFALRRKIRSVKMAREEAERLVDLHVLMYFDGFGGPVGKE